MCFGGLLVVGSGVVVVFRRRLVVKPKVTPRVVVLKGVGVGVVAIGSVIVVIRSVVATVVGPGVWSQKPQVLNARS